MEEENQFYEEKKEQESGKSECDHQHQHKKGGVWKLLALGLLILLIASILTSGFSFLKKEELSKEEAAEKTMNYINTNLLQGGAVAELKSTKEEKDLYVLRLEVNGREVDSYVTKDGELLFVQAINMSEEKEAAQEGQEQPAAAVTKSDKPKVELFVMSHCPYGMQAEKGILPAVEKLGKKIDFSVKFVYYAMHGKQELDEQMNQVCIQEEQSEKFNSYLKCFLSKGEGEKCLAETKIDKEKLTACAKKVDEKYKVMEKFNDQSTWLSGRFPLFDVHKEENEKYGVKGSPVLIINGQEASSERSPAAYLKTICGAFNEAPEECKAEMSTTAASPGTGEGSGSSGGSCG